MLAFELEGSLTGQDLADDGHILPGPRERLAVRDTVPALDDLGTRGSETEDETTARERVQGHRRHSGHGRCARGHLHDRRPETDLARARADPREGADRVRPIGLRGPDRIEAETLGLEHKIEIQGHPGPGVTRRETEAHHALLSRGLPSLAFPGDAVLPRRVSGRRDPRPKRRRMTPRPD